MKNRTWFPSVMAWMSFNETSQQWERNPPPYPRWALPPSHDVPAEQFIRIWNKGRSLNEVKSQIFWKSIEELEEQREQITLFLRTKGYEELVPKSLSPSPILDDESLKSLEKEGLITVALSATDTQKTEDTETYDAARAIFDAVPDQTVDPHSSIASFETLGRFRGRH
jgi:hypothetical protein